MLTESHAMPCEGWGGDDDAASGVTDSKLLRSVAVGDGDTAQQAHHVTDLPDVPALCIPDLRRSERGLDVHSIRDRPHRPAADGAQHGALPESPCPAHGTGAPRLYRAVGTRVVSPAA